VHQSKRITEIRKRGEALVKAAKALACCLDAEMANQTPFVELAGQLGQIDGPGEVAAKLRQDGNVVPGPWAS
jgi:hypothetical protein